jgi:plastocyanin
MATRAAILSARLAWLLPAIAAPALAGDLTVEVRDALGNAITDAVVYAEPVGAPAPAPRPDARATIDQVNKEFVPRVTVVRAGTQVSFPNSDNIRHSIYSFSPAKTFTTKLYSGREAAPVLFDTSGLVVLGCNIHDKMVAWVIIVDTPWFARTGADGVALLRALPPGEYRLTATAPSAGLKGDSMSLHVETSALTRTFKLPAGS